MSTLFQESQGHGTIALLIVQGCPTKWTNRHRVMKVTILGFIFLFGLPKPVKATLH